MSSPIIPTLQMRTKAFSIDLTDPHILRNPLLMDMRVLPNQKKCVIMYYIIVRKEPVYGTA